LYKSKGFRLNEELMMARYFALVDGEADAYGVTPDLPGCTSGGSTTDEALRNAKRCGRIPRSLRLLPKARRLQSCRSKPCGSGPRTRSPMARNSPRRDPPIDEAAAARGLTRSAFLAGAAREKIESGG
jgi:hypothetical protein